MVQKPFGFLLVDKPVGWTSFDVCAKLRGKLGIKKIGHTGTLDPFATGLLIIAVGKATKLIPFFEKDRKIYETEVLLGHISETLDTESEITNLLGLDLYDKNFKKLNITKVLNENFLGKIQQVPPKYSALKIGGKKMCDMARKGQDFEIKSRETEVYSAEIIEFDFPVVKIRLEVSAGFYVRSFARDLGVFLGLGGGICQQLRRIEIGDIATFCHSELDNKNIEKSVDRKISIVEIEKATIENLISPEKILKLPQVQIPSDRIADFLQGRVFPIDLDIEDRFIVLCKKQFLGIGCMKCGKLQPRLGFV